MSTVKVKVIQSHAGIYGMVRPGDTYETDTLHAQELVNNGLVTAEDLKVKDVKKQGFVEDINVAEKSDYKKGDITKEKQENKTGNVPTAKKSK